MNVHARARASAQAIDRSATRLDPVAGLDDLLRRRRRQPLRRVAAVALTLLVVAVAIWAGAGLRRPTPQPTLGPVTRFRVGPAPVSVAVTPGVAWVLIPATPPSPGSTQKPAGCNRPSRRRSSWM